MNDTKKHNPYESPKSILVDEIEDKLSKKEYEIFLSITQLKPLSDIMQNIQNSYKELLRIGETVYICIDATIPDINVPKKHVEDGTIVLDISPKAISNFNWSECAIEFIAKFKSKNQIVKAPFDSLLWIYSGETKTGYELNKV